MLSLWIIIPIALGLIVAALLMGLRLRSVFLFIVGPALALCFRALQAKSLGGIGDMQSFMPKKRETGMKIIHVKQEPEPFVMPVETPELIMLIAAAIIVPIMLWGIVNFFKAKARKRKERRMAANAPKPGSIFKGDTAYQRPEEGWTDTAQDTSYNEQRTGAQFGQSAPQRGEKAQHLFALGFEGPASPGEIKRAYRALAKAYHPDRLSAMNIPAQELERAKLKMKSINTAYEYLMPS